MEKYNELSEYNRNNEACKFEENLMKEEKVYFVKFNEYTNGLYSTVVYYPEDCDTPEYLNIPYGGLVVKESELDSYRKFGNGYKTIKLVGSMYFKETN